MKGVKISTLRDAALGYDDPPQSLQILDLHVGAHDVSIRTITTLHRLVA